MRVTLTNTSPPARARSHRRWLRRASLRRGGRQRPALPGLLAKEGERFCLAFEGEIAVLDYPLLLELLHRQAIDRLERDGRFLLFFFGGIEQSGARPKEATRLAVAAVRRSCAAVSDEPLYGAEARNRRAGVEQRAIRKPGTEQRDSSYARHRCPHDRSFVHRSR